MKAQEKSGTSMLWRATIRVIRQDAVYPDCLERYMLRRGSPGVARHAAFAAY
jgi:hypothetical protein